MIMWLRPSQSEAHISWILFWGSSSQSLGIWTSELGHLPKPGSLKRISLVLPQSVGWQSKILHTRLSRLSAMWQSCAEQMSNTGYLLERFRVVVFSGRGAMECQVTLVSDLLVSDFDWETSRSFDLIKKFSDCVHGKLVSVGCLKVFCGQVCLGNASLNDIIKTSLVCSCALWTTRGGGNRRSSISLACVTTKLGISRNS